MNLGSIFIKNLTLAAVVNVDSWERPRRQPLIANITAYLNFSETSTTDTLKTTCYSKLCAFIREFVEKSEYRTIEALAAALTKAVLEKYRNEIEKLNVKLDMPKSCPVARTAGIELTRTLGCFPLNSSCEFGIAHPNDHIFISDFLMPTIIGVKHFERNEKQVITLHLKIFMDTMPILFPDEVLPQFNYRNITKALVNYLENSEYKTLETLAENVAEFCMTEYGIEKIEVTVEKPKALTFAEAAGVAVTRSRGKNLATEIRSDDRVIAYLGIGSNVNDRYQNILCALDEFAHYNIKIVETSFLYESSPVYVVDQPNFLNCVVKISCPITDFFELLSICHKIEKNVGRVETFHHGPRVIDLDILYFGNINFKSKSLTIPHVGIPERAFVLRPLVDIAPEFEHPGNFRTNRQMFNILKQQSFDAQKSLRRVLVIGNKLFDLSQKTLLMGVLNITPDSFSDGGKFLKVDDAIVQAKKMLENGVDIIDIGGASTRPGADDVPEDVELSRVIPIIKGIRKFSDIPISIDTSCAKVAAEAVLAGANLINDVTGGRGDPEMYSTMARLKVPVCLMHSRGTPKTMMSLTSYEDNDVICAIKKEMKQMTDDAIASGILRWNIILDPGIGFAKDTQQDLLILKSFSNRSKAQEFFPLLFGPSKKKFLGKLLERPDPQDRLWGTATTCAAAVAAGASIVRVHDIKEMKDVVCIADAIWRQKLG